MDGFDQTVNVKVSSLIFVIRYDAVISDPVCIDVSRRSEMNLLYLKFCVGNVVTACLTDTTFCFYC